MTGPRGQLVVVNDDGAAFFNGLRDHVAAKVGPMAKPRQSLVVPEPPKTRSGKIMRRLLRDVAEHPAEVTTLADSSVVDAIAAELSSGTTDD